MEARKKAKCMRDYWGKKARKRVEKFMREALRAQ